MRRYLLKRILLMFPTLLGAALLIFILMRVVPGDIVELKHAAEGGSASQEILQTERANLFDMDMKFADVLPLAEVLDHLRKL